MTRTSPPAIPRRLLGLILLWGILGRAVALQVFTSSTNLYVDLALVPPISCGYAMISITNNEGVTRSNLWVTIGGFTNSSVALGGGDQGQFNLGTLAANEVKPASFYLQANSSPVTNRYTITVYQGYPGIGTQLSTTNYPIFVSTTANGNNNKVTACSYSPTQPVLGSLVTLLVSGTTAPLSVGRILSFTPATATNWQANAFRLEGASITNPIAAATYTNTLFFLQAGANKAVDWSATYSIRAVGTTASSVSPSPDGAFQTGGSASIEHSSASVTLPAIPPPTNSVVLTNFGSVSQLYTNETVFFTNRFWNSSSNDVWLDRVVDILPTGFVYVTNSSTFNGASTANPNTTGVTNTWSVPWNIQAGSSRDFVFQAVPTGANTFVTNYAIAYIGTEVIDRTLSTTDSAPAASTVRVLWEPQATNDSGVTLEDIALPVSASGVLANDNEPNGFTLTVLTNTQPSHGSVTVTNNGGYTYVPSANYNGSDSFTYVLTNANGRASTGTVSLTITAVNDPPSFTKGADQSVSEDAGAQTVAGWATAISAGPSDESGQTLTFHVSNDNPNLFSAQPDIALNGTLTYTPAANSNGVATVSVYLTDNGGTGNSGSDTSPTQTFTITVNAVNDPPVVGAVTYSRAWGTALRIAKAELLSYASDVDIDPLVIAWAGGGTNGSAISTNGNFVLFGPTNNLSESFLYAVSDGTVTVTNWVTVNVTNAVVSISAISPDDGGGITLQVAGVPGYGYVVERAADANGPWTSLDGGGGTPNSRTNAPGKGQWSFKDAAPPAHSFYRVRQDN